MESNTVGMACYHILHLISHWGKICGKADILRKVSLHVVYIYRHINGCIHLLNKDIFRITYLVSKALQSYKLSLQTCCKAIIMLLRDLQNIWFDDQITRHYFWCFKMKKKQTPIISNNTLIFHKMSSFITHAYMLYEYKIKQVEI